ncbi:hypothetical protein [Pseudomonas reinekei]|uniref:hypothetical protein n=1 Tax=Pseudomonas reinekei TaxID=395598 RepID=UPI001390393F|nr:hypothetical protein [Pseudomonas reinekei]
MATINVKTKKPSQKVALAHLEDPGYQTRSLFFSDRPTIEPGPKAHKPADSGVSVGNDARRCSFHEVTLTAIKQALEMQSLGASRLAPAQVLHTALIGCGEGQFIRGVYSVTNR